MEVSQEKPKPAESFEALQPPEPVEKKPAALRRPRVKQVSSRFMTPLVSSSRQLGDLHLPSSKTPAETQRSLLVQRRLLVPAEEPLPFADQNRVEAVRSSDTPFPSAKPGFADQRKRGGKLFKENAEHSSEFSRPPESTHLPKTLNPKMSVKPRSRTDTPAPNPRVGQNHPRAIPSAANSAAAKLIQTNLATVKRNAVQDSRSCLRGNPPEQSEDENASEESSSADNLTLSDLSGYETCSLNCQPGICESPPIHAQASKIRPTPELRSSMPERDLLPTMSARLLAEERNAAGDLCRVSAFPFHRALNSSLSSSQDSFNPTKMVSKSVTFSRAYLVPSKVGSVFLPPPHPSNVKAGTDARKGRGGTCNIEYIHSLKLLYNRLLQWRFANANAEAAMSNQRVAAERLLHAAVAKVSDMHESVSKKRIELGQLKLMQALSTIQNSQMPYLEEWGTLEDDYTSSLTGITEGLQNASVRLPTTVNVRVDLKELREALSSTANLLEAICSNVETFLPEAERVDTVMSDLAGVVGQERSLIEECGDMLSLEHMLQEEEHSLRCQLIQLKQTSTWELVR